MILAIELYKNYAYKKIKLFKKTKNIFFKNIKISNDIIYNNIVVASDLIFNDKRILLDSINKYQEYEDKDEHSILGSISVRNLYKLVCICTKKGKKKLSYKVVKKALLLIRSYFYVNPFYFLNLALKKTEHFLKVQILKIKSRQKVIPRLLFPEQRKNLSLRIIVNNAIKNVNNYRYFYISLANSIIYYALININNTSDTIIITMNEMNELASLNKYLMFKKRRRKKFKIIKKINK